MAAPLVLVFGVLVTFAFLALLLPEPPVRRRASSANGIPISIGDAPSVRVLRFVRARPASLDPARAVFGEVYTRGLTPLPLDDDDRD